MNTGFKHGKKLVGGGAPAPMGSAPCKGTMGNGTASMNAKGVQGSGKQGGAMAKGVQGRG